MIGFKVPVVIAVVINPLMAVAAALFVIPISPAGLYVLTAVLTSPDAAALPMSPPVSPAPAILPMVLFIPAVTAATSAGVLIRPWSFSAWAAVLPALRAPAADPTRDPVAPLINALPTSWPVTTALTADDTADVIAFCATVPSPAVAGASTSPTTPVTLGMIPASMPAFNASAGDPPASKVLPEAMTADPTAAAAAADAPAGSNEAPIAVPKPGASTFTATKTIGMMSLMNPETPVLFGLLYVCPVSTAPVDVSRKYCV